MANETPRLLIRSLPMMARLGLTGLVFTLLIGLAASVQHLVWHYENRDDQKGFTKDDVTSAYHGLEAPPKLLTALQRGHPDGEHALKPDARDLLIKWIQSGRINEDYENIDLGAATPREIIQTSCLSCHAGAEVAAKGAGISLASPEDIRKIAFARKVQPTPKNIVVMSMHAHALSMATMSLAAAGLLWFTRVPRALAGLLIAANGVALPVDLAAWWFARTNEWMVNVIIGAGGVYNATFGLMLVVVVVDLWWPRGRRHPPTGPGSG